MLEEAIPAVVQQQQTVAQVLQMEHEDEDAQEEVVMQLPYLSQVLAKEDEKVLVATAAAAEVEGVEVLAPCQLTAAAAALLATAGMWGEAKVESVGAAECSVEMALQMVLEREAHLHPAMVLVTSVTLLTASCVEEVALSLVLLAITQVSEYQTA